MIRFAYEAVDRGGGRQSGEISARSRAEALAALRARALQPVSLAEGAGPAAKDGWPGGPSSAPSARRLRPCEVIHFTEEICDLLDAGLPLDPALRVLEQRTERSRLPEVIAALRRSLSEGVSFSQALRRTSPSFGELYCSMVAAGEMSGSMAQILRSQAVYLAMMQELRSRMIQALIYPAFLATAGVVLLVIFMSVLVPQLSQLFAKTGRSLPLPTRLLIGGGEFFAAYWWALGLGGLVAAAGFFHFLRTPFGRRWWHEHQLRIPLVGPLLEARLLAQMARTLANLCGNGLPLLTGLELLARSMPNLFVRAKLERAAEAVREGKALSRALARIGGFPGLLIDLLAVGEQTGDLAAAFRKIGDRYDKDLSFRIKKLTACVQPAIVVIMAFLVGLVAYSILTGIFQAVSGLRTR